MLLVQGWLVCTSVCTATAAAQRERRSPRACVMADLRLRVRPNLSVNVTRGGSGVKLPDSSDPAAGSSDVDVVHTYVTVVIQTVQSGVVPWPYFLLLRVRASACR